MPGTSIEVIVRQAVALTKSASRYRLGRPDHAALAACTAGGHIPVSIAPGITRAYSLCGDLQESGRYAVAVTREEQGRGGGIVVDTACEQGGGGGCVVAYSDDWPIYNDERLSDEERAGYVAVCQAGCRCSTLALQL